MGEWQIRGYALVSGFLFVNIFSSCGSGCVQFHFGVFFLSASHCSLDSASLSCFLLSVLPGFALLTSLAFRSFGFDCCFIFGNVILVSLVFVFLVTFLIFLLFLL